MATVPSLHAASPRISRSGVALIAGLVIAAGLAAPPAGAATTPYPSDPTGTRVSAVSASSFTVSATPSSYATGYKLFASTTKTQVYVANIKQAKASAVTSAPKVTIGALPYSTATWYYRFGALNSRGIRYSPILSANLRPAMPTALAMHSGTKGTSLTWSSGATLGFRIAQSTDASMAGHRVDYTISSQARQFTPYALKQGTRYYFRVSSINGSSGSTYSLRADGVVGSREQSASVLTYNILTSATAGSVEGDGPLAPWSQRRAGVARLIRTTAADVVAVQEGGGWASKVEGYGGIRQVDDLAGMLASSSAGAAYTLAGTETPPSQHGYTRTGNYIFYKKSAYAASGAGGHWAVGGHGAAYQVLTNRSSGARFLFVSAHLSPTGGTSGDAERLSETKSLINQATALASKQGVPVVYAGDFNSHGGANHAYDGPGIGFNAVHATDALQVAQSRVNANYNSANQNVHQPLASGLSIDHLYAPAGVAVHGWHLWVELTKGLYTGTLPSDHNPLSITISYPATN